MSYSARQPLPFVSQLVQCSHIFEFPGTFTYAIDVVFLSSRMKHSYFTMTVNLKTYPKRWIYMHLFHIYCGCKILCEEYKLLLDT